MRSSWVMISLVNYWLTLGRHQKYRFSSSLSTRCQWITATSLVVWGSHRITNVLIGVHFLLPSCDGPRTEDRGISNMCQRVWPVWGLAMIYSAVILTLNSKVSGAYHEINTSASHQCSNQKTVRYRHSALWCTVLQSVSIVTSKCGLSRTCLQWTSELPPSIWPSHFYYNNLKLFIDLFIKMIY